MNSIISFTYNVVVFATITSSSLEFMTIVFVAFSTSRRLGKQVIMRKIHHRRCCVTHDFVYLRRRTFSGCHFEIITAMNLVIFKSLGNHVI